MKDGLSEKEFERELAVRTAPSLLGVKPANLLTVAGSVNAVRYNIDRFNALAADSGLHIRELKRLNGRTLILLYNERVLEKRLGEKDVRDMFCGFGYEGCESCTQYLERLRRRLENNSDFPHEVGLFLGYPVEDIRGFIDNKGRNFLLCGYWKVYANVEGARRTFRSYDRCVKYMAEHFNGGGDIYGVLN